jgi:hypothetical protein
MTNILIGGIVVLSCILFFWALYLLYKEYKRITAHTPDDDLYDLDWKIESSLLDDNSELYLINLIKKLQRTPGINQERLKILDRKFRERFQELHITDEYSPTLLEE